MEGASEGEGEERALVACCQFAAAIPSEGAALLRDLLFQPSIVLAVPQLVESLSPLLGAVDPRGAEVGYTHHLQGGCSIGSECVCSVCCSLQLLGKCLKMKRCVQFVREFCHSSKVAAEGVVEAGVAGLYFVCCSDFIDKCLDLSVQR